ncbi:Glu/Leu/Phe/Val dehydrogenase dimerization domain-containing protein [Pendulispora albinea]|uniref:NAD(P)-binding domain-containing protein n=1 Tax=Pendulispora albinea TaxID=2741071 RepID=A0ABZ2M9Y1_9BACT
MMTDGDAELYRGWGGELVASCYDEGTGAFMFICVHSTVRGPAAGGIRLKAYDSPGDGLRDGMRLSRAMSLKMAICGAPLGGGKAVIALDSARGDVSTGQRGPLLERFAALLASLKGTYYGAPDMNTGPADMDFIHARSPYVFCRTEERGGSGSTTQHTALGVFCSILASAEFAFGSRSLAGKSVVVQGVGEVGAALVGRLVRAGARVTISDVAEDRVAKLAAEFGVASVAPEAAAATDCDIFAPCATGGVLNARSIPELRCAVVAGAANNQLATPEDDARLHERGILYAPDFVASAGGVLHGVGLELWRWSEAQVDRAVEQLGDTLLEVFAKARAERIGTHAAAEKLARAKLAVPRA